MFCVECGQEAGDALVGGLCHDCLREKRAFTEMPDVVDFEVCAHCGARKRGEQWVHLHRDDPWERVIEESALEAVSAERDFHVEDMRVRIVPEDQRNYGVTVEVQGLAEGVPVEEVHEARARIKNGTCTRCSRFQGGYFESIVQVRAKGRDLSAEELAGFRAVASRLIERIVNEGDPNAFVLRDQDVHGGLDIYVGTMNAGRMIAKAIAQERGGRISEHPKLVGRDRDGLDMYRVTFAVRVPAYRTGDYLVYDGNVHEVGKVTPKLVTLHDLKTGRTVTAETDDVEHAPILRPDEARPAVVVSRGGGEMQVLDPWTYQTVSVLDPPEGAPEGNEVQVLKWEGELIALPSETAVSGR